MDEILNKAMFATTERWLYNLSKWRAEIVVLQEQLNDYSGKVTVGYSSSPGGSGPGDGTFARTTVVIEAEERLPKLLARERMLEAAIDALSDTQKLLVSFMYIKRWENSRTWGHLCLSEREFYRERRLAVEQVGEILYGDQMFRDDVESRVKRLRESVHRQVSADVQ